MDEIIIPKERPAFTFLTNTFVGVPIIFQFDATPLLYLTQRVDGNLETESRIFNQNGDYLAKWKGRRLFATALGEKANLKVRHEANLLALELDSRTLCELRKPPRGAVSASAELYAPTGHLLTGDPTLVQSTTVPQAQKALRIGGSLFQSNLFVANAMIAVHGSSSGEWRLLYTPNEGDPFFPKGGVFVPAAKDPKAS